MTYNVFGGTLNRAQQYDSSSNQRPLNLSRENCRVVEYLRTEQSYKLILDFDVHMLPQVGSMYQWKTIENCDPILKKTNT